MNPAVLFLSFMTVAGGASSTSATGPDQETYLLPAYTRNMPVDGMHGSVWRAELIVHNALDRLIEFGPCNRPLPEPCPPVVLGVGPGETVVDPRVSFPEGGSHGRLVYVRREDAAGVEMKLRLADVSRRAIDAGTEMPVIRSAAFASGPLRLHNIPAANEEYRVMLRVFDVDDTGPASSVEIRISTLAGELLHAETRQFTPSGHPHVAGLPTTASLIEMPLPAVASEHRSVRIEIVPLTAGLRFWAYASVTSNVTHHVLLVTPP
jgi:hypothetical protein